MPAGNDCQYVIYPGAKVERPEDAGGGVVEGSDQVIIASCDVVVAGDAGHACKELL